jgi:CMP-N,N'-diacetyllegionaminic acid synthase
MRSIAVIPARKGSKGVYKKNLQVINGRTLVEWAISAAKKTPEITEIYVDTDCEDVAAMSRKHNCLVPRLRPKQLAGDNTLIVDSIKDFLELIINKNEANEICVVLLQPTSPFRTPTDISHAIGKWQLNNGTKSVYSVSNPIQSVKDMIKKTQLGFWTPVIADSFKYTNRQDIEGVKFITGGIYVFSLQFIVENNAIVTEKKSVFIETDMLSGIDIDSYDDLELARSLAKFYSLSCS